MSETDISAVAVAGERGSSSTPIMNLAQDHLFAILHLLPVDSILSFSMTCKRFRDLACSDGLWEAVCRRKWGPATVEALKSSSRDGFAWMKLFERVRKLDSVCCHVIPNPDAESLLPSPRASHSLNFVTDYLVLFGGGCEGGRHLDDTWTAYVDESNHKMLKWKKVDLGTPSGRFGHTCIVVGQQLILFGGINDRGHRYNDTWIARVTFHEELSWKLLNVGPVIPPCRGAHAACCIGEKKIVIHGGIGLFGVRLGDTWVLELSEDMNSGTWRQLVSHPSPPPRSGHSLTCIRDNQVVLFGGRGSGYNVLDDVWLLDIQEHSKRWIQIFYDFKNVPASSSLPRVGHSATLILGGWLLIYGGEDSYRHRKDDFWAFDVNTIPATGLQPPAVSLNGSSAWRRLNEISYRPKCRSFHRACVDRSGRYVYMSGGMVDGLLQPAASSGLRFGGELFMVELVLGL
ncbi:PREDICTED: F-box/kelch-repeat protein At1g51550-like [Tarenaya hassleriana]|uniref:F-box/kelch-repeat protein At1g51550-like n=1 Tax=Tarenaya hassleriana TaxID=28532 RepID=UPI00053C6E4F|nr:PREDICTED: F-box/kelch-repeat protein At1g51550-like [Tarenaya hassleriana]